MTPFDPVALLAMLLAFYPIVGPAAFDRARRERPAYFAGASIIGTGRDKIRLPDGRIFDGIFDVGGPGQRWQMLEILPGDGTGGPEDPFRLEAGPLDPIDESAWPDPAPAPVFVPLVVDALTALGAAGGVLDRAHGAVTDAAAPGDLETFVGGELGTAAGTWDRSLGAVAAFLPADELAAAGGQGDATLSHGGEFNEPTPGPLPPSDGPLRPPGALHPDPGAGAPDEPAPPSYQPPGRAPTTPGRGTLTGGS